MTPDGLSRALNGQRGFAAVELARIAHYLGVDIHYLITGEVDPHQLVLSARHSYDPKTHERHADGFDADKQLLANIRLAYVQAGLGMRHETLPSSADQLRDQLGSNFVRHFGQNLEQVGIDVIQIPGLSTAYSFVICEHPVIVVQTTGNWFYTNWSIAHELGHLLLGHEGATPNNKDIDILEREANAFAADLLLPVDVMNEIDWTKASLPEVAQFLWDSGVSTKSLKTRLQYLQSPVSNELAAALETSTQTFLRRYWDAPDAMAITNRMTQCAERKFPDWLITSHVEKIAKGDLAKGTLAWMLGVSEDNLEVEEPELSDFPDGDALLNSFLK